MIFTLMIHHQSIIWNKLLTLNCWNWLVWTELFNAGEFFFYCFNELHWWSVGRWEMSELVDKICGFLRMKIVEMTKQQFSTCFCFFIFAQLWLNTRLEKNTYKYVKTLILKFSSSRNLTVFFDLNFAHLEIEQCDFFDKFCLLSFNNLYEMSQW